MSDFLTAILQSRPIWEKICSNVTLPRMRRVRQAFPRDAVVDVGSAARQGLEASGMAEHIRPGARIAICCGSRGIANLPELVRASVAWTRSHGGEPFILPAMGSHGGGTAQGQIDMLASLGVSEATVGAPIVSNLDTKIVGEVEGYPVHVAVDALQADACLLICRVKPHTAFRGPFESGFMKMLAIGLGKHKGALTIHRDGFGVFARTIPLIGNHILHHAPILGGVGVIENAFYQTAQVHVLCAEDFQAREPELLRTAFHFMGKIFFDALDVLAVDEIGKNFSGAGMDPNITGTFTSPYGSGGITAESKIVFGISEASHGNATGIGTVDFITARVFAALDPVSTYVNAMTARSSLAAKIPLVLPDERSALHVAVHKSPRREALAAPRIVHIRNTESVEYISISEALWPEAEAQRHIAFESQAFQYKFTPEGEIIRDYEKE